MLRVGFVLHAMPVAGAEVLTAETIRHLKDRIQPTIFCLDYIGTLGEELQAEGVEVVCLNRRSGRDWRLVGRLRRAIQQRRIQVLHAHQYTPFFYAACAKFSMLRHRPKLIFTEHGRHFPDIVSWKRRLFNRCVLSPVVDDINACCRFSADALRCNEGFTTRPVGVIFNGIDLRRYNPMPDRLAVRQTLGLDPQRRYVLTVARFHPVKDHATLLRALAVVTAQRPDVDLLLAGDGPLRPDLEQLAQSLNIRPHVHFLGVRSDVPILMQAADVFALTSVTEAASLTLMEAMASGLPVVVTNVGGNPELVQNGVDGLLVPRADPQATGEAILRVLSDPALAADLGRRARQRAEQQFLLDQTIAEYATLYEKLVGKSSY
jgi:glycosyltransferase involved in cell wall biosynthesis